MDGLTEGRIVHYVMPDGQHRPAIVVNVWRDLIGPCEGYINAQVFTDGSNDMTASNIQYFKGAEESVSRGLYWATSICPDEETKKPGTWHWIEKA